MSTQSPLNQQPIDPDFWDDPDDAKIRQLYFDKAAPSDDTPQAVKQVTSAVKKVKSIKSKLKTKQQAIETARQQQKRPSDDALTLQELSSRLTVKTQERSAQRSQLKSPESNAVDSLSAYAPPKRFDTNTPTKRPYLGLAAAAAVGLNGLGNLARGFAHKVLAPASLVDNIKQLSQGFLSPSIGKNQGHRHGLLRNAMQRLQAVRPRYLVASAIVMVVVLAGLRTMLATRARILKNGDSKTTAQQSEIGAGTQGEVQGQSVQKPDFATLSPDSSTTTKSQEKFDPTKKVASFQDKLKGSPVVVSQQKLAEKSAADPQFLSGLAQNMYLKQQLTTNKGTAYVGTNVEKNVQTVAFVHAQLLVLIRSDKTYSDKEWTDYINSLQ